MCPQSAERVTGAIVCSSMNIEQDVTTKNMPAQQICQAEVKAFTLHAGASPVNQSTDALCSHHCFVALEDDNSAVKELWEDFMSQQRRICNCLPQRTLMFNVVEMSGFLIKL